MVITSSQTTATATGLIAGTYTVTVTDAHLCTAIESVTINQPSALTASISGTTAVLCYGDNTGTLTVTAGGGITPYSYAWNTITDGTTPTISNLVANYWYVVVTDANNCSILVGDTIKEPAEALWAYIDTTNVTCNGYNNGIATVNAFGGTSPYTYLWSDEETSATVDNLSPGTYTVTVTDAHGCNTTVNVLITQPDPLSTSMELK